MFRRIVLIMGLLFFSSTSKAQLSMQDFLQKHWDTKLENLSVVFPGKEFTKLQSAGNDIYTWYDWIDPFSVKVGFIFNSAGVLVGKTLSNSGAGKGNSQAFSQMIRQWCKERFGDDGVETNLFGKKMVMWKNNKGYIISFIETDDKVALTIAKK